MEAYSNAFQVYGYAVCLVAIVAFHISITALTTSLIDSSAPLFTWRDTNHLLAFENFKLEAYKLGQKEAITIFDEATLKQMYKAAINHKIYRVQHHTIKNIVVNSLLIVICLVLSIVHWRWRHKTTIIGTLFSLTYPILSGLIEFKYK